MPVVEVDTGGVRNLIGEEILFIFLVDTPQGKDTWFVHGDQSFLVPSEEDFGRRWMALQRFGQVLVAEVPEGDEGVFGHWAEYYLVLDVSKANWLDDVVMAL